MRTAEEKVAALNARMNVLRNRRERQKTAALGAGCGVTAACLIVLVFDGASPEGSTAGMYTGATMLFENAGGYVLLAIGAFMLGVIITALCIRGRRKP